MSESRKKSASAADNSHDHAGSGDGKPQKRKRGSLWEDPDDANVVARRSFVPPRLPLWAKKDSQLEEPEEAEAQMADLLRATEPLLEAGTKRVAEIIPVRTHTTELQKDSVSSVKWHHSAELLVVGSPTHVSILHVTAHFSEKVHRWSFEGDSPLGDIHLMRDTALIVPKKCSHMYSMDLNTGATASLKFMDSRLNSAPFAFGVATKLKGRHHKVDLPVTCAATPWTNRVGTFACASGNDLLICSLQSGSILHTLRATDRFSDIAFRGEHEIWALAGSRVVVFDIRGAPRQISTFADEGSMQATRLALTGDGTLIVGSNSGVVNLYKAAEVSSVKPTSEPPKPFRSLMNLSARVDLLATSQLDPSLFLVGSSQQRNGLRFVNKLPEAVVVPGFPPPGNYHKFMSCVAFNPGAPLFSVGEEHRVVHYRHPYVEMGIR